MLFLPHVAFIFISLYLPSILCFCVYNEHFNQTDIDIYQIAGHGPSTTLNNRFSTLDLVPGYKKCCHFSNYECNSSRSPKSILRFAVRRKTLLRKEGIFNIDCPAGGYIVFSGDAGDPKIEVFNADHSQYNYRFNWYPDNQHSFSPENDDRSIANALDNWEKTQH